MGLEGVDLWFSDSLGRGVFVCACARVCVCVFPELVILFFYPFFNGCEFGSGYIFYQAACVPVSLAFPDSTAGSPGLACLGTQGHSSR